MLAIKTQSLLFQQFQDNPEIFFDVFTVHVSNVKSTDSMSQVYNYLWHKGWKAVTDHSPLSGLGNFDKDRWSLFHTDEDRAEAP
jgi:hypothetical protein